MDQAKAMNIISTQWMAVRGREIMAGGSERSSCPCQACKIYSEVDRSG